MVGYIPGAALHGIQLIGRYLTRVAFIQQLFHEDLVIVTQLGVPFKLCLQPFDSH